MDNQRGTAQKRTAEEENNLNPAHKSMKTFACPMSATVKTISILTTVLLVGVMVFCALTLKNKPYCSADWWITIGVLLLLLTTIVVYAAMQPRFVVVDDNYVVIKKRLGQVVVERDSIIAVKHKKSMMNDIRMLGNGGMFGLTGIWSDGKSYHAYVTNEKQIVMIETGRRRYAVSCDSPDKLLEMLGK